MKKLLLTLTLFFFFSCPAWAVTYYCKIAGGNYSAATTWSATSSAGVDNAGVPTSSIDVVMDAASATTGALVIDATAAAKTFDASSNVAGTITHNAFNWTISGSFTLASAMTAYTPLETSTLTLGGSGTLTTGGKLMPNITTASNTTITLGDNLSFMNSKIINLTLGNSSSLNQNGKSINGNSAINRILIKSNTIGSPKIITNATTSFTNSDFRDITFSTAGALDLSGITGGSGDCGGNSATGGTLTMTTSEQQTATGSSANWSTATWTGANGHNRVPLPQDDYVISLTAGQTLTVDVPRLGRDGSFGTATKWTVGNIITLYGSFDATNSGTFSGSFAYTFERQLRTGTSILTSAGKTIGNSVNVVTVGATLLLGDANVWGSGNNSSTLANGTFNDGGFSLSVPAFIMNASSATRGVIKTGIWTLRRTSTNLALDISNPSGFFWSDSSGSIIVSDTGSAIKTIAGVNNQTINSLTTPSGTGGVAITGANNFNQITVTAGGKLTLPTTVTTNVGSFTATGDSTHTITLLSSTGGSAATLNKTGGGQIQTDYLDITDINVTPASTWYYGNNSSWHSGTGWRSGYPRKVTVTE